MKRNLFLWVLFTTTVIVSFVANKSYETFFFRPCSAHMWRQCDGASYALNYYQNKGPFLPSQVHHRHAEHGYAVSEFPIVYYLAAKAYQWFGFHDYYIRWIHFAFFILGLIYLTRIAGLFTYKLVLQLIPAAFTITSPYLYYYSANFLPDVAAFSLALIGLYYFLRWDQQKKIVHLLWALSLFTLAACLKISAAILMMSCLAYLLYDFITNKQAYARFSGLQKILISTIVFLSLGLIYAWIAYDKYVAEKYHFGGNLFGFYGIWDADKQTILYILSRIKDMWVKVIFSKYLWFIMLLLTIGYIKFFKQLPISVRVITLFSFIGVVLFSICWYKTFDVHDYYMINLFCLPVMLFICGIIIIEQKNLLGTTTKQMIMASSLLILFTHSLLKCRGEQLFRYYEPPYNTFNTSIYRLEPYLRQIGIKRTDLVISVPDPSPNITLYLMNQIGYTEAYTSSSYDINVFVGMAKAKYLIVSDSNYLHQLPYQPYCTADKQIGEFEGIRIFKTYP